MFTVYGSIHYNFAIDVSYHADAVMVDNGAHFPTDYGWFWLRETGTVGYYHIITFLRDPRNPEVKNI
jgi:hypothetical protein